MNTLNYQEINKKINLLPKNLLQEVNDYIDFLTYKNTEKDWANYLTEKQKELIEQGKRDIENNNMVSQDVAKERIKKFLYKNKVCKVL
jgi:Protein of unknown function (DUF2281)